MLPPEALEHDPAKWDNRFAEKDHAIQGEEERDRFNPKRSCFSRPERVGAGTLTLNRQRR
jgi:hypothetical protein